MPAILLRAARALALLAACAPLAACDMPMGGEPDPGDPEPGDPDPGGPPMPADAPYAAQWALEGALDVDLLTGDPLAESRPLRFEPAFDRPVVIGLIDTGIDPGHPELRHALWHNPGEIAGDCVDNDGNGYVDDVHGIRVDVHRFDGILLDEPARTEAIAAACAAHGGSLDGEACVAPPEAAVEDARAIAGLEAARRRAASSLDGNPLLHARACPDGAPAGRAERVALAEGDPTDTWYGHGTLMAGTMAALSPVEGEVAGVLQLPTPPGSGPLAERVRIATCAAGFQDDVHAGEPVAVQPMGTADGFARCLAYFADLVDAGVDLRVVNLSLGFAERFPSLGAPDLPMVDEVLLHRSPAVIEGFAALVERDVSIVAAAHNLYRDVDDTPAHAMYPAAFELDGLIGVGGINRRGTWFGNRGRRTVDVVAPAFPIISPAVRPSLAMMQWLVDPAFGGAAASPPFDRMPRGEGTSQATAYVSTVVALMRAHRPTAALDAAAVRRRLIASSSPLPPLPAGPILRESANPALLPLLQLLLGPEPPTREAKQAELRANGIAGGIVRLDAALDCHARPFRRLTGPVQRQAGPPGAALVVEAEAFDCETPAPEPSLAAHAIGPDGARRRLALDAAAPGLYRARFTPEAPGEYAFALDATPDDRLVIRIE